MEFPITESDLAKATEKDKLLSKLASLYGWPLQISKDSTFGR